MQQEEMEETKREAVWPIPESKGQGCPLRQKTHRQGLEDHWEW